MWGMQGGEEFMGYAEESKGVRKANNLLTYWLKTDILKSIL